MTNDDQYVPHESYVREAWVDRHGTGNPLFVDEAGAEFDRFLARVRRDAAREAMEDLASDFDLMGSQEDGPEVARWIRAVIDTEYPEETP